MPVAGYQDYWLVGSIFMFQRDPVATVAQPWRDLGTVQASSGNPSFENQVAELFDPRGGKNNRVARSVTQSSESYNVTLNNINGRSLALLFGAEDPEAYTQAVTPLVDISHPDQHEGELIALVDANGVRKYMITSIQSVKEGTVTLTVDVDWEIENLEQGLLRLIQGAPNISGTGDDRIVDLLVSYTPAEVTGNRLILPGTNANIEGSFELWLDREDYARRTVRRGRCTISAGDNTAFDVSEYSSIGLTISQLYDLTSDTPGGELISIKGDLPAKS